MPRARNLTPVGDVEAQPATQLASDVPLQRPTKTTGAPHEAVSITPARRDDAECDERLRERPGLGCTHIARRLVWREAISVLVTPRTNRRNEPVLAFYTASK